MAMIRGHAGQAPDLKADTIAVLLRGWSAHPPKGVNGGPPGFGGGFAALACPDGPARLWRQHERYLRGVAAEWGWAPTDELPDGRRVFYGEGCALPPDVRGE